MSIGIDPALAALHTFRQGEPVRLAASGEKNEKNVGRPQGHVDVCRLARVISAGSTTMRHPEHGGTAGRQHE